MLNTSDPSYLSLMLPMIPYILAAVPVVGYGLYATKSNHDKESKKTQDLVTHLELDEFKTLELNTMLQWSSLMYYLVTLRGIVRKHKNKVDFVQPELIVSQHLDKDVNPYDHTHLKKMITATDILNFMKLNQKYLVSDDGGLEFNEKASGRADLDGDGQADVEMMQRLEQVDDEFDADIIEFDDEFCDDGMDSELVFCIIVNRTEKRVAVCFRGSVSMKDWVVDLSGTKSKPEQIKEFTNDTGAEIHTGFSEYLFGKTNEDGDGYTKFTQIVMILKQVAKKHPDFKIYVTGHSLGELRRLCFSFPRDFVYSLAIFPISFQTGGALTQLLAFALAGSKESADLPKPIIAVSYASPRVGNKGYLEKYKQLEKEGLLRHIRVSNQGDIVTVSPSMGFYQTGLNIHVAEGKEVEIGYCKDRSFMSQLNTNALGNHGLPTYHGRLFISRNTTAISMDIEELYKKYT
mmetsp:Transcript_10127/g.14858  ORF Transcript_10127/g.14858 Transcript_10127/m.14858 type:complete len:461 (+) Transcript_10127:288-1670(+)